MWASLADVIGVIVGGVTDLIKAIAWPLVVLIGFLLFRRELPKLIGVLARRVRSVSIAQVSVEFAVQEFRPAPTATWALEALERLPGSDFVDDSIRDLVRLLEEDKAASYVVVDFATTWFSSRLFLYADLLDRARSLPCIVFVEKSRNISRRFVGMARPRDVCLAFAQRQPWLASAYSQVSVSLSPMLDPETAKRIAVDFRGQLRDYHPHPDSPEWSLVGDQWEHATQVTAESLRHVMGRDLRTTDFIVDSPDLTEEERRRLVVLRGRGDGPWVPFVAALDEERAFVRLLDRARLLEAIARDVGEETSV